MNWYRLKLPCPLDSLLEIFEMHDLSPFHRAALPARFIRELPSEIEVARVRFLWAWENERKDRWPKMSDFPSKTQNFRLALSPRNSGYYFFLAADRGQCVDTSRAQSRVCPEENAEFSVRIVPSFSRISFC
jgi:hypothetical protein